MDQSGPLDQIPLHLDTDASSSILQPHDDNVEAQLPSAPSAARRQSSVFNWVLKKKSQSPDDSNDQLKRNDDSKWVDDHYALIKDIPGKALVESLMRCVTYEPPAIDKPTDSSRPGGPHLLSADSGVTVAHYLHACLMDHLHSSTSSPYLDICAFVAESTTEAEHAFSFSRQVLASFGGRLHTLYSSPKAAIVHCLADAWGMTDEVRDALKGHTKAHPRYPPTQLPSSKASMASPSLLYPRGDILSHGGASIRLEWQDHPREYRGDLDIYVWQYHLDPPPGSSVNLFIMPTSSSQQRRIAVQFEPRYLLDRFAKTGLLQFPDPEYPRQHEWTASHEVLRVILVFFDWLTHDTAKFVDRFSSELREMTRRGRQSPSPSKIHYLLHLDDCRRKALEDLTHSKQVLRSLNDAVEGSDFGRMSPDVQRKFLGILAGKQKDIDFLKTRVHKLAQPTIAVREQIKEQMDLASGRRTIILTVLAALFIPLSFVSGIFGMNVTDPLFPVTTSHVVKVPITVIQSSTTYTSTSTITYTAAGSPTPTSDSTSSSSSNSNQHFWDVSLYLEIALPLALATIILPLIIGAITRYSVRTAFHYKPYWRLLCAFGALAYLGLVYGFLYWFSDECGGDCPLFWYYSRSYATFVVYLLLVPGVLAIISMYTLFLAFRRKRRRRLWLIFSFLVIGCVLAELFLDYPSLTSWGLDYEGDDLIDDYLTKFVPVPLTIIPWIFLIFIWVAESKSFKQYWNKPSAWLPFIWRKFRTVGKRTNTEDTETWYSK